MSQETDRILGHSTDNDGIEEYDNALPDWWQGMFLFTIVWAIGYAVDYHLVSQRSQTASYEAEMAAAQQRWPEPARGSLAFDEGTVAAGGELFAQTCVACHGADLSGGIGPSLVDAIWIHGSEPEQIRATIERGVPEKGMPAWGPMLGPDKVAKLAAFVSTRSAAPPTQLASSVPTEDSSGEAIFQKNCVVCHGPDLEGKIGPNLTDTQWIHGGRLEDIERVVTQGVPEKGMVSWGPILGPEKIREVARFVHAKGTAPQ
jgi:cytochrome c oxidase cbb3-type subunit 3